MVKFKFSANHGINKKGTVKEMQESTAKALEVHKVGKIVVVKDKE